MIKSTNNSSLNKVFAYSSFAMGILGLIAIVSPLFGALLSIPGLILGILGKKYKTRSIVVIAIILNIISLLIAIIALMLFWAYYKNMK